MDIRKVQNIVKEIYAGGNIKVNVMEELDSLDNKDKILAIGSSKTISYQYLNASQTINNYFKIIDESNSQMLTLINKYTIPTSQYFPVFAFSTIYTDIKRLPDLKSQQKEKIKAKVDSVSSLCKVEHSKIDHIMSDTNITQSNKNSAILWGIYNDHLGLDEVEQYLRTFDGKTNTDYRCLLCAYDLKRYNTE